MRQNQIPPIAAYFDGMGYGILGKMPQAIGLLRYLKAVATKQPGSVPPELIAALDANLFTKSGRPADALLVLMAQDTTNVLVMSHIAEAHSALGHVAEYHAWTKKITANHAIALGDFSDLYARSRATLGPGF